MQLDASLRSVPDARHHVRATLRAHSVEPDLIDLAELLTSELVTNAFVHAQSGSRLAIAVSRQAVAIRVCDESRTIPIPRRSGPIEESGRGLQIVAALASRWGVRVIPGDGKEVWFELARPLSPPLSRRRPTRLRRGRPERSRGPRRRLSGR